MLFGAYYVKVIVKSKYGKKLTEFKPKWWDKTHLLNTYPFEEEYKFCFYTYRHRTTLDVLQEINELNRSNVTEGVFAYHGWQEIIVPELERIDRFLKLNIAKPLQVCIELVQWESGY